MSWFPHFCANCECLLPSDNTGPACDLCRPEYERLQKAWALQRERQAAAEAFIRSRSPRPEDDWDELEIPF